MLRSHPAVLLLSRNARTSLVHMRTEVRCNAYGTVSVRVRLRDELDNNNNQKNNTESKTTSQSYFSNQKNNTESRPTQSRVSSQWTAEKILNTKGHQTLPERNFTVLERKSKTAPVVALKPFRLVPTVVLPEYLRLANLYSTLNSSATLNESNIIAKYGDFFVADEKARRKLNALAQRLNDTTLEVKRIAEENGSNILKQLVEILLESSWKTKQSTTENTISALNIIQHDIGLPLSIARTLLETLHEYARLFQQYAEDSNEATDDAYPLAAWEKAFGASAAELLKSVFINCTVLPFIESCKFIGTESNRKEWNPYKTSPRAPDSNCSYREIIEKFFEHVVVEGAPGHRLTIPSALSTPQFSWTDRNVSPKNRIVIPCISSKNLSSLLNIDLGKKTISYITANYAYPADSSKIIYPLPAAWVIALRQVKWPLTLDFFGRGKPIQAQNITYRKMIETMDINSPAIEEFATEIQDAAEKNVFLPKLIETYYT